MNYLVTVDATYIFLNQSNESFYGHDIIGKRFRKILKQSGVKARPLYNLRHTFASQMISKGADITWVSKMLWSKMFQSHSKFILNLFKKMMKRD